MVYEDSLKIMPKLKMIHTIEELFMRDLNSLKNELQSFQKDEFLWKIQGKITNPAGVLSQHLCGNLNHFIGAVLGNTGYLRNRDNEFSETNIPREKLIMNVEETIDTVKKTLSGMNDTNLEEKYPIPFAGKKLTKAELLFVLISHLSYHLGQINYLRRMNQ